MGRFINLYTMIKRYASFFYRLSRIMVQMQKAIDIEPKEEREKLIQEMRGEMWRETNELGAKPFFEACNDFGLKLTRLSMERFSKSVGFNTIESLKRVVEELDGRVRDELESVWFMHIPNADLYNNSQPFGPEVNKNFPSAAFDIEEAAKCLAVNRSTACVFHLMRIMEIGLRSLGKTLNDPTLDPKTNPTWERILSKCDRELQKPIQQRSSEWQQNELFFSQATANLRAVKDAWRNPTLHVEMV